MCIIRRRSVAIWFEGVAVGKASPKGERVPFVDTGERYPHPLLGFALANRVFPNHGEL